MKSQHTELDHYRPAGPPLTRRVALRVAAAGAAAGTIAVACGGGRKSQTVTGPSAEKAGQPRRGGQLVLAEKGDPETLDPSSQRTPAAEAMGLTNDSLLGFKTGADVKYTDVVLRPVLAERWETPDAQTFIFHLRNGVNFANLAPVNGRPFTGDDVKWTYEYYSRTGQFATLRKAPVSAVFAGLDRIETPDSATVSVHFTQPYAAFLSYAAWEWSAILAHEIFDADGDFAKRAVGTGAWQIDNANTHFGQRWTFKRNPGYFMQGLPYIDEVDWLILTDDVTTNSAFQTKQIDTLDYENLSFDTVQQMKKGVPETIVYQYLNVTVGMHVYMNVSKPPLDDSRIRKAIGLSIDRDEIIKVLSQGQGQWALDGAMPGVFTEQEIKQILKHDPAQAKQLVAEAGHPNGVDVQFMYPGEKYGQASVTAIQLLQSQLKQGNINLTLKSVAAGEDATIRESGAFQMAISPKGYVEPLDIGASVYALYHPKSGTNWGRVDDPQLTPLLDAQRAEVDPAKRRELVRQAVRRINEEPWGFSLYYGAAYALWRPYLKNYAPNAGARAHPILESWLEK